MADELCNSDNVTEQPSALFGRSCYFSTNVYTDTSSVG